MTDNTLILYTTQDGTAQFVLRELGGQLWLTQAEIAALYQITPQSVTQHIRAIYRENEISEAATCKEFLQVQTEGGREVRRQLKHYALPMIIAIGYRVRSTRGTQFRQWATRTLGGYLQKGFAIDDERLKNPPVGTVAAPDYFDELLERIRDIRASESACICVCVKFSHLLRITSLITRRQPSSSKLYKTSCISPARGRPPRKSYSTVPTHRSP